MSGFGFQFLIGTLKTKAEGTGNSMTGQVSIPDRYAKNPGVEVR